MKRSQFNMFYKMISTLGKAKLGEYVFTITQRGNGISQLNQTYGGATTTLKVGSHKECVEAAKECVEMMYDITD